MIFNLSERLFMPFPLSSYAWFDSFKLIMWNAGHINRQFEDHAGFSIVLNPSMWYARGMDSDQWNILVGGASAPAISNGDVDIKTAVGLAWRPSFKENEFELTIARFDSDGNFESANDTLSVINPETGTSITEDTYYISAGIPFVFAVYNGDAKKYTDTPEDQNVVAVLLSTPDTPMMVGEVDLPQRPRENPLTLWPIMLTDSQPLETASFSIDPVKYFTLKGLGEPVSIFEILAGKRRYVIYAPYGVSGIYY